jgi:Domain of Unknown Function (DUF928)
MLPRSLSIPRVVIGLGLGLTMGLLSIPTQAMAQEYNPPDRGLPGRREGGGTRGGCLSNAQHLVALMPVTNFGLTTQESPSLFWYIPPLSVISAEFVLLDANDNEVYTTTIQLTGNEGIVSLAIPLIRDEALGKDVSRLEVGKDYHWYFSLICDARDRSSDIFVEGWIQRTQLNQAMTTRLETTPERDRPTAYAELGLWYDALGTLATLRQAQPQDETTLAAWNTLLNSVDLSDLAGQPLL